MTKSPQGQIDIQADRLTGIHFKNLPETAPAEKTVVVLGTARGGTSMVANVLVNLGVNMGTYSGANFEDEEIVRILRRDKIDHKAFSEVVAKRNQEFGIWGWKFPTRMDTSLYKNLRNPYFIIIFRDPVAIASRQHKATNQDFFAALTAIYNSQKRLLEFLDILKHPIMVLSYEKSLVLKKYFVDSLVSFLDLEPTEEVLAEALDCIRVSPQKYLRDTKVPRFRGHIDAVRKNSITGWVVDDHDKNQSVEIRVVIDDKHEIDVKAEKYRKDLQSAGFGNGNHGFVALIPTELMDGKSHKVNIMIPGAKEGDLLNIRHSGKMLPFRPGQVFIPPAESGGEPDSGAGIANA